jgi:hypothetical protein
MIKTTKLKFYGNKSQSVQIVQKKLISLAQQRKSHWCNSLTLCEKHPNIHVLYLQLYFNEVYICVGKYVNNIKQTSLKLQCV